MNGANDISRDERERYVRAFNDTMVKIWKEKIALLKIVDTGLLLRSVRGTGLQADKDYTAFKLEQQFRTYGIFQELGTGRETPRGNSGDIGRAKVRKARPWFTRKYLRSVYNINEFMADNLGSAFCGTLANALGAVDLRKLATDNS